MKSNNKNTTAVQMMLTASLDEYLVYIKGLSSNRT